MHVPVEIFGVLAIGVVVSVLIETAQWLLIYRKPKFRQLKERLAATNKKLDGIKSNAAVSASKAKSRKKKEDRLENSMKMETSRYFMTMKMLQMAITMASFFSAFRVLNRIYGGVVVGRLPFEPWPLFRAVTHRGLPGSVWTEASATFVYSMCLSGVRANISQALGLGPDRRMQGLISNTNEMVQRQFAGGGTADKTE